MPSRCNPHAADTLLIMHVCSIMCAPCLFCILTTWIQTRWQCDDPVQDRLKKLRGSKGKSELGKVTVDMAIGGMRGIPVGT